MKCLITKNIPLDEMDCKNGIIAETFDRVDVVKIIERPDHIGGDIAGCKNDIGSFYVYLKFGDGVLES